MKRFLPLYVFIVIAFLNSCGKEDPIPVIPQGDTTSVPISSPATEPFELGVKADYASSSISLSTGKWNFTEAMIGSTTDDKKSGTKSARIRGNGKISMNFDVLNGVYKVVISHAVYANDQPSNWQLWASNDRGATYFQVGSTITSSTSTLKSDSFRIVSPDKIRFSIRKVSGDNNQINIDDIRILQSSDPLPVSTVDNDNMLMGNPSNAIPSILSENNMFIDHGYYALSYDRSQGKTSWASWHLNASDLGSAPRQNNFRADTLLPATWYRAETSHYSGSGFDRGHICPSADRTSTVAANSSTFFMTNIIPQAPNLNQITWSRLEDSLRLLVTGRNSELYIITGSFGSGGTNATSTVSSIYNSNIIVPAYVWKVAVVLPNGNNDISRVNNATRVIAVLAPNQNSANADWKTYRVSVDAIEAQTGYDLLSNLPAAIQQVIEARVDNL